MKIFLKFWQVLALITVISIIIMLVCAKKSNHLVAIILPVTYLVMVYVTKAGKVFFNRSAPGLSIVNMFYFVKCTIYPLLYVISNNTYNASTQIINYAIILESGEIIVIYSIFSFYQRIYKRKECLEYSGVQNTSKSGKIIIAGFLIFVLGLILAHPASLYKYNLFTVSSLDVIKQRSLTAYESSFTSVMIDWAKTVLVIVLCRMLYLKYRKNKKKRYIVFSALVIMISTMIVTEVSRSSFVIPAIIGFFLLMRFYPKYTKQLSVSVGSVVLLVFVVFSNTRYGSAFGRETGIEGITDNFQAYLCGLKNMTVAIKTREMYANEIGINTFFSDLFGNWMGIGALFRSSTNINQYFNLTYYGSTVSVDQIVPTIGQSYIQFGSFGTYIYTIVMSVLIMTFDRKYCSSTKIEYSYLLLLGSVKCAITLMGNFKIFMATLLNTLLPLAILFYFNSLISVGWRNEKNG